VRSFAFSLPAPILEANTIRLLARLIGLMETVELGSSQKTLWAEAARRVDPDRPGPFNQAMMDLGATICTPRQPACLICPVNKFCKAHEGGLTESIPLKAAKSPLKPGEEISVIVKRPTDGSILLLKRPAQGLWADFWELPTFWQAGADPARRRDQGFEYKNFDDLIQLMEALMGLRIKSLEEVQAKPIRYGVTTHKMTLNVVGTELMAENLIRPQGFLQAEFVALSEITKRTMSTAQRKALKIPLKG
jgi:adenine-specific DNA glycosylase